MDDMELFSNQVDEAVEIMREVAAWGRNRGFCVWRDECLTKEELITTDAQPENFYVMPYGGICGSMIYKYCEDHNFEDFASGRVIVHRPGYPNFPVRLAQEIFSRCLCHLDHPDQVCIFDPCCGGGYLLTILEF